MNYTQLIPVCLISILVGQLLPRLFESTSSLILASVGYLLILVGLDFVFNRRSAKPE